MAPDLVLAHGSWSSLPKFLEVFLSHGCWSGQPRVLELILDHDSWTGFSLLFLCKSYDYFLLSYTNHKQWKCKFILQHFKKSCFSLQSSSDVSVRKMNKLSKIIFIFCLICSSSLNFHILLLIAWNFHIRMKFMRVTNMILSLFFWYVCINLIYSLVNYEFIKE